MSVFESQHHADPDDTIATDDRRLHQRIAMRAPASLCLGGGPWRDFAVTRNLSAGGALIEMPCDVAAEYTEGDPLGFEVRIPASEGVWPASTTGMAEAIVLRSADLATTDGNDEEPVKRIALRFVDRLRFRFD